MSDPYIDKLKELRILIESCEPSDRLGNIATIRLAMRSLQFSFAAWWRWIHNPEVMECFDEKEIEATMIFMKDVVPAWLIFDENMTELVNPKIKKMLMTKSLTQQDEQVNPFST